MNRKTAKLLKRYAAVSARQDAGPKRKTETSNAHLRRVAEETRRQYGVLRGHWNRSNRKNRTRTRSMIRALVRYDEARSGFS